MSQWIKSEIFYCDHVARLCMSKTIGQCLGFKPDSDPDVTEKMVIALIADKRPELAGGVLLGIQFSFSDYEWQFLYSHPSLPKCDPGSYAEKMPLFQSDEVTIVISTSE